MGRPVCPPYLRIKTRARQRADTQVCPYFKYKHSPKMQRLKILNEVVKVLRRAFLVEHLAVQA